MRHSRCRSTGDRLSLAELTIAEIPAEFPEDAS
jgi:hypothetical protein